MRRRGADAMVWAGARRAGYSRERGELQTQRDEVFDDRQVPGYGSRDVFYFLTFAYLPFGRTFGMLLAGG